MCSGDARPAFHTGFTSDLTYGADELSVYIDVILLDPAGYTGRVVLWDTTPLSHAEAALIASPACEILGEELGADRIVGIEVWHLRSGQQYFVSAAEAATLRGHVGPILSRLAS